MRPTVAIRSKQPRVTADPGELKFWKLLREVEKRTHGKATLKKDMDGYIHLMWLLDVTCSMSKVIEALKKLIGKMIDKLAANGRKIRFTLISFWEGSTHGCCVADKSFDLSNMEEAQAARAYVMTLRTIGGGGVENFKAALAIVKKYLEEYPEAVPILMGTSDVSIHKESDRDSEAEDERKFIKATGFKNTDAIKMFAELKEIASVDKLPMIFLPMNTGMAQAISASDDKCYVALSVDGVCVHPSPEQLQDAHKLSNAIFVILSAILGTTDDVSVATLRDYDLKYVPHQDFAVASEHDVYFKSCISTSTQSDDHKLAEIFGNIRGALGKGKRGLRAANLDQQALFVLALLRLVMRPAGDRSEESMQTVKQMADDILGSGAKHHFIWTPAMIDKFLDMYPEGLLSNIDGDETPSSCVSLETPSEILQALCDMSELGSDSVVGAVTKLLSGVMVDFACLGSDEQKYDLSNVKDAWAYFARIRRVGLGAKVTAHDVLRIMKYDRNGLATGPMDRAKYNGWVPVPSSLIELVLFLLLAGTQLANTIVAGAMGSDTFLPHMAIALMANLLIHLAQRKADGDTEAVQKLMGNLVNALIALMIKPTVDELAVPDLSGCKLFVGALHIPTELSDDEKLELLRDNLLKVFEEMFAEQVQLHYKRLAAAIGQTGPNGEANPAPVSDAIIHAITTSLRAQGVLDMLPAIPRDYASLTDPHPLETKANFVAAFQDVASQLVPQLLQSGEFKELVDSFRTLVARILGAIFTLEEGREMERRFFELREDRLIGKCLWLGKRTDRYDMISSGETPQWKKKSDDAIDVTTMLAEMLYESPEHTQRIKELKELRRDAAKAVLLCKASEAFLKSPMDFRFKKEDVTAAVPQAGTVAMSRGDLAACLMENWRDDAACKTALVHIVSGAWTKEPISNLKKNAQLIAFMERLGGMDDLLARMTCTQQPLTARTEHNGRGRSCNNPEPNWAADQAAWDAYFAKRLAAVDKTSTRLTQAAVNGIRSIYANSDEENRAVIVMLEKLIIDPRTIHVLLTDAAKLEAWKQTHQEKIAKYNNAGN